MFKQIKISMNMCIFTKLTFFNFFQKCNILALPYKLHLFTADVTGPLVFEKLTLLDTHPCFNLISVAFWPHNYLPY